MRIEMHRFKPPVKAREVIKSETVYRIHAAIDASPYSVSELARRAHVDESTYRSWLDGGSKVFPAYALMQLPWELRRALLGEPSSVEHELPSQTGTDA